MAYNKTNWQNLPSTTTPITANNLNNMENGIEKSDKMLGGTEYDATATYDKGDYCIYNNTLYRAKQDIDTAEAFTPAHWDLTTVENELDRLIKSGGIPTDSVIGYDGSTIPSGYEETVNPFNYVDSEVVIGMWNNNPIYRKIVRYTGSFAVGDNDIAHGITNLGRVIDIKSTMYPFANALQYRIPYIGSNSKALVINKIDNTNITVMAQEVWSSTYTFDFILEYTKTTD